MTGIDPLRPMLEIAITTTKSQRQFFLKLAEDSQVPEVKALLMVLADSESEMIDKLHHMVLTGVLDEIQELRRAEDRGEVPDPAPFDPSREDSDPRIFVCNRALEKNMKTYMFFLSLATKAKSELVSSLFEYLAYMEMKQINELRRVCQTF